MIKVLTLSVVMGLSTCHWAYAQGSSCGNYEVMSADTILNILLTSLKKMKMSYLEKEKVMIKDGYYRNRVNLDSDIDGYYVVKDGVAVGFLYDKSDQDIKKILKDWATWFISTPLTELDLVFLRDLPKD